MSGYCECRHAWSSHQAIQGCQRCTCTRYRAEPETDLGQAIARMTQASRDAILRRISKPKD